MKLSVINKKGGTVRELASAEGKGRVHLVYEPVYKKGDRIRIKTDAPGNYEMRLEDTLMPAILYMNGTEAEFEIPFGQMRAGFSPRSFTGKRHFIEVREVLNSAPAENQGATGQEHTCRNLAFNPYDGAENTGLFPHMSTNVTYPDTFRNRIIPDRGLFAARNVIDGVLANESHRLYPHQSWGINRDPNAYLTCEFGRPVDVESVRLAIRGEFPHDNYWVRGTLVFSDGSREEIAIKKTLDLQEFPIRKTGITSVTLCELIPSEEPSLFPALSLLEVYGRDPN